MCGLDRGVQDPDRTDRARTTLTTVPVTSGRREPRERPSDAADRPYVLRFCSAVPNRHHIRRQHPVSDVTADRSRLHATAGTRSRRRQSTFRPDALGFDSRQWCHKAPDRTRCTTSSSKVAELMRAGWDRAGAEPSGKEPKTPPMRRLPSERCGRRSPHATGPPPRSTRNTPGTVTAGLDRARWRCRVVPYEVGYSPRTQAEKKSECAPWQTGAVSRAWSRPW